MTPGLPGGAAPRRPGRRGGRVDQRTLSIIAALLVVVVVVTVVRVHGRNATSTKTPTTSEPAEVTTTTAAGHRPHLTALERILKLPDSVPPGDYGPLCQELVAESAGHEGISTLADVMSLYAALDMAKVIQAAPDGVKADFEELSRDRSDVLRTFRQADVPADLGPADFPNGFVSSLAMVLKVGSTCAPASGSAGASPPAGATTGAGTGGSGGVTTSTPP